MIRETREGGGRENEKDSIHQKSLARIYIRGEGGPEPSVKFKHVLFSYFFKEVWINYNRIHLILCIFFQHFQTKSGTSTLSLPQNDRFLSLEWMGSVILIHVHVCSENVQLDCTELRLDEILTHLNISNKNCSEMIHVFILLSIF